MIHNFVELDEKEIITNLLLDKLALERKLEIAREEVDALKINLANSIPTESIAAAIKSLFETGRIPMPEFIDKNFPTTIKCDKKDVSFYSRQISISVRFDNNICSGDVTFLSLFVPETSDRGKTYPYFHFGYSKEEWEKLTKE